MHKHQEDMKSFKENNKMRRAKKIKDKEDNKETKEELERYECFTFILELVEFINKIIDGTLKQGKIITYEGEWNFTLGQHHQIHFPLTC